MSNEAASKLYEWISYILIVGATVIFFAMRNGNTQLRLDLTLVILVVAVYMRALMYRSRYRNMEDENEELKRDLRRMTALLSSKNAAQKKDS